MPHQSITPIESADLRFQEGRSDKVYQAAIEPAPGAADRYLVTFAYGRRGNTLTTGTKTPQPVPLEQARQVFEKLVHSKLRKGYHPTLQMPGQPYHRSGDEGRDTGIRPQLLNPVDESEVGRLLASSKFCLQQKHDGRRLLVLKHDGIITGINRRGLRVALPEPIAAEVEHLPGSFLIDGEAVGDTLHVFDLLERNGIDQRGRGLIDRLTELEDLLHERDGEAIVPVPPAFSESDKRALWAILVRQNAEGVVFKTRHSPYRPGRPASGGDWLKFKFVETASFIVAGRNGTKRSVGLELVTPEGNRVPAGNVTIPENHEVPEKGVVIECRYLYAHRQSEVIYQPVYLGSRDDIPAEECTVDQLKFKAEPPAAATP